MKDYKKIIWTEDIDENDFEDDLGNPLSYEEAQEVNFSYLDDERSNLDIAVEGEIICIGDIGHWTGRRSGYQLVGHNVKNILYPRVDGISSNEFFYDGKDIRQKEAHHDGTNYYTYRVLKGKTHDEQVANAEKLFSKRLNPHRIGCYTRSLAPEITKVYGW